MPGSWIDASSYDLPGEVAEFHASRLLLARNCVLPNVRGQDVLAAIKSEKCNASFAIQNQTES